MSGLLFSIRQQILGKDINTLCSKNFPLSQTNINEVLDKYNENYNKILTQKDVENMCSITKGSIENIEERIDLFKNLVLGDTSPYCEKDGAPLPKTKIRQFKKNKLQNTLSDHQFLQLCKTSGKFEATIIDMIRIILYDKKNEEIPNVKQNISKRIVKHIDILMEFLNPATNQKRKEEIKQLSKNFTIINRNHYFYSSYPLHIKKEDFELYKIVWCSPELSQSLLYMLGKEKALIQPVFYKFKFAYDLFVMNAQDMDNNQMFENILDKETLEKVKRIYPFEFSNNLNVLCLIEAINIIVRSVENTNRYRIYGYRNRFDQNELAILDFDLLVNKSSIEKAIFEEVALLDQRKVLVQDPTLSQKFPIILKFPFYDNTLYNEYMDKLNVKETENAVHFDKDDFHVFLNSLLIYDEKLIESYRVSCPVVKYVVKYYYETKPTEKLYFRCKEMIDDSNPDYEAIKI